MDPLGPFLIIHLSPCLLPGIAVPLDSLNGLCSFSLGIKTPSCPPSASPGTHTLPRPGSSLAVSETVDAPHDQPRSARAFDPQRTVCWEGHIQPRAILSPDSAPLAGILALAAPQHREHIMNAFISGDYHTQPQLSLNCR